MAPTSRRLKEALSWRMVAELMRRHPGELKLIEAHGGGCMYDELRIYRRGADRDSPFLISLNRSGSAHFHGSEPWASLWSDAVAAEDPKDIVDELERRAGMASGGQLPPATPEVLTVRTIASLLEHAAFQREHWEALNGYCDSSDGSQVRQGYFDAFPLCSQRLRQSEPGDLLGKPAYRFWFLVRNGKPRLALEETGRVWDLDGEELNLVARRKRAGELWPIVAGLSAEVFR